MLRMVLDNCNCYRQTSCNKVSHIIRKVHYQNNSYSFTIDHFNNFYWYYDSNTFCKSQTKSFDQNTSLQRQQTSLRLTRTIFCILLCQVILSLPRPIINFMYLEHWGNPEVERKLHYWARALIFSNSIANALIHALLQGQNGKKR